MALSLPGYPKRLPSKDKIRAPGCVSRFRPRLSGHFAPCAHLSAGLSAAIHPMQRRLIKPLRVVYSFLIAAGFFCVSRAFRPGGLQSRARAGNFLRVQAVKTSAERTCMDIRHPEAIWLIPPILAVAFLLWALWNFWKEDMRERRSARAAQPQPFPPAANWERPVFNNAARDVRSSARAFDRPLGRPPERIARS
jgi:hypothetical protein